MPKRQSRRASKPRRKLTEGQPAQRPAARAAGKPTRRGSRQAPPIVGFVSLGCAKNLVDSERMLGQIAESGAILAGDESLADTIVVNTCGFLGAARQEALEVLAGLAQRKREGTLGRLVVAGCLVQRDGADLLTLVPEIDALVGVHQRDQVATAVWGSPAIRKPKSAARPPAQRSAASPAKPDLYLGEYHPQPWSDQGRLRLTPRHYAYVRISEGCDQKCTFCTIPQIRGPLRSKTPSQLLAECRELVADGARELILIGQDTTSYGSDLDGEGGLAGLLRKLDASCTDARWLRLMYAYPRQLTDEMIGAIADCRRVVKYIDIPLQHINDRLLRAMGRRVTRQETETLLGRIRNRIPGVTIRTTFIVGFPGETEAEFAELLEFVRGFGFDAVGAFKYSHEPETPAARIAGRLDDAGQQERYGRLMLAQQEVALAAARRRLGSVFEVVVDGPADGGGLVARHAGQAPEVDAVCRLAEGSFEPGEWLTGQCVETAGYDLVVRPVGRGLPMWK